MSGTMREAPLLQMGTVEDVFVAGLAKVEHLGCFVRLWFQAPEHMEGEDSGLCRVVKARLILPVSVLIPLAEQMLAEQRPSVKACEIGPAPPWLC